MSKKIVSLKVNGKTVEEAVEPRTLLVHFLREKMNLTGAHIGCETSHCGACTVDIDGQSVKSCTHLTVQCEGSEVKTVEGLANGGVLHAARRLLQRARPAMRLLHTRHADARLPPLARQPEPDRSRSARGYVGQLVPLHWLPKHRQSRVARSGHPPTTSSCRLSAQPTGELYERTPE